MMKLRTCSRMCAIVSAMGQMQFQRTWCDAFEVKHPPPRKQLRSTNEEQERVKARPMNWQISITALSLCLSVLVLEGKSAEPSTAGMVLVPAGRFAPLFRGE